MPNFDGGHYFLTVLAPIRTDSVPIGDGRHRSHVDLLREALSRLPTARQNRVTRHARLNSPFARNRINHLARFVVIDDVVYNGRNPSDPILGRLRGVNPIEPQPVDRLKCSYLVFAADLDAASGDDAALRRYTDALWSTMREELTEVFGHCLGFDAVRDADGFFRWIARCRVETTMPFNDYWTTPIPAEPFPVFRVLALPAAAAAVAVLAFLLHVLGVGGWAWGWISLVAALAAVGLAAGSYYYLVGKAQAPFPTAPDSDLPSVLKALYLQQRFTDFAIRHQGADDETLYRAFGDFIQAERPADTDAPTQAPGVIDSRDPEGVA